MSLAVSSILFLVLLLPGVAFRLFYYAEEFSKEFQRASFAEQFLAAFVPALVIHGVCVGVVSWPWPFYDLDLRVLFDLASDGPSPASIENLRRNGLRVCGYIVITVALGALGGWLLRRRVREKGLDRSRKLFRYRNVWHYLFRGEVAQFPRADFDFERDAVEDVYAVTVNAVVEIAGGAYLYDGALVDYELDAEGQLAFLTLRDARRRRMEDDEGAASAIGGGAPRSRYYDVKGHLLTIRYDRMVNLNIAYWGLDLTLDEVGQPVEANLYLLS